MPRAVNAEAKLWGGLRKYRDMPEIDMVRLRTFPRPKAGSICTLVAHISLRYTGGISIVCAFSVAYSRQLKALALGSIV